MSSDSILSMFPVFIGNFTIINLLYASFYSCLAVCMIYTDLSRYRLPNILTHSLFWGGALLHLFFAAGIYIPFYPGFRILYFFMIIASGIVGYLTMRGLRYLAKITFQKEGIGLGDCKLFGAIISWASIHYIPIVLFGAAFISLFLIIQMKLIHGVARLSRKIFKHPLPTQTAIEPRITLPIPFGPPLLIMGGLMIDPILGGQLLITTVILEIILHKRRKLWYTEHCKAG